MNWASSSENRSTLGSASVAPMDPARVGLAFLMTSLCDTFAAVSIISKLIRIQMLTHHPCPVKIFYHMIVGHHSRVFGNPTSWYLLMAGLRSSIVRPFDQRILIASTLPFTPSPK